MRACPKRCKGISRPRILGYLDDIQTTSAAKSIAYVCSATYTLASEYETTVDPRFCMCTHGNREGWV